MRSLLVYLLLITAMPADARIYRYTDADGHPAYSDQPPAGAPSQTIELAPPNRAEAHKVEARTASGPADSLRAVYDVLELEGMPNTGVIRANDGTFTVEVRLQPRLLPSHRLRLLLDGQPYGQSTNAPSLQLVNIDRGEHQLAVQVLDGENLLQQSPSVTFTLQRAHRR